MIVTFLGTGTSQGVPVIACNCDVCNSVDFKDKRLRTSLHVQSDTTSVIIDTGPDFRQQVLRERIARLDAVVYTHEHKDHTAGLDDIRGFNFAQKEEIPVYARPSVIDQLKIEFSYIFSPNAYPGIPRITTHEINGSTLEIGDIELLPIDVMHLKLPVYGYRIGDFTYITDANYISEEEIEKIKGSKVLVLNALQKEDHISHFNLEEALKVIESVAPEQAFLTHISHRMGKHFLVEETLPEGVKLAFDGLKIEL